MPTQKRGPSFRGMALIGAALALLAGILFLSLYSGDGDAATAVHKTPPYAPWLVGPTISRSGKLWTYKLYVRNNLGTPLTLQGGLSYLQDAGSRNSQMSVGNHFPVVKSDIPFGNARLCGCLGRSWVMTIAPSATRSYLFTIREPSAKKKYCVDANFYAPAYGYSLRARRCVFINEGTA